MNHAAEFYGVPSGAAIFSFHPACEDEMCIRDRLYTVGAAAENRALVSLAVEETASGGRAVARVANYGAACEIQLEGYADGALCDVRTAQAGAGDVYKRQDQSHPCIQRAAAHAFVENAADFAALWRGAIGNRLCDGAHAADGRKHDHFLSAQWAG